MSIRLRPFLVLFLSMAFSTPSVAQQSADVARARLLPIEDGTYEYIERLQRRGHLLELNPTALPYSIGAVRDAISEIDHRHIDPVAERWVELVESRLDRRGARRGDLHVGAELRAGSRFTTTSRLDVMRPLGQEEPILPFVSIRGYAGGQQWAAQFGVTQDRYYVTDPDGLNSVLRLRARNEENYVGGDIGWLALYAGRFAHHWSQPSLPGLLISNNPRSYDLLSFRIGTERLSLRSIFGELDAMTADEQFTGRAFQAGSVRRYISAHRVDWRPSTNITVSFIETGLFSGTSSGFSLKYLNPIQVFIFAIDNQPKNDENKGLIGGNLWMQFGRTTLNGQLLIDDVDLMGQTREPVSIALTGSAVQAGVRPWLDLGLFAEMVTARTYNTHQKEGQYLYMLRGLATNFSDYIQVGMFADVYADQWVPNLRLSPRIDILWQGEYDMRDPFPENVGDVGTILKGVEEQVLRLSVPMRFQPTAHIWMQVDPGVNFRRHVDHVEGASRTHFVGLATIGVRLPISGSVGPLF